MKSGRGTVLFSWIRKTWWEDIYKRQCSTQTPSSYFQLGPAEFNVCFPWSLPDWYDCFVRYLEFYTLQLFYFKLVIQLCRILLELKSPKYIWLWILNIIFAKLCFRKFASISGAHTLGFSHCSRFADRIYRFNSRNRIDPTLNLQYAMQLRQMCPVNVDSRIAINMDPTTPRQFDNAYYQNLKNGKGLFTSDQILFTDSRSKGTVNLFASNNAAFQQAFVTAITKLGRVGVLTGNQGEIRRDCSRIN
jgi:hypothetical protein